MAFIKGKKHSEETKKKIRKARIGQKHSEESKRKIGKSAKLRKRLPHSEETKKKISESHKGKKRKPFSEETRKKMSEGLIRRFKKNPHSKETREKMSKSRKGNKCYAWKGGISFEPYSVDWTNTLKRSIRERDRYTCQVCSKQQGNKVHDVHHIDYNKKNCNPDNLITLCRSCHSKTNKNRKYWTNYFIKTYVQQTIYSRRKDQC